MQFEIRNRCAGAVQITAEIDCAADTPAEGAMLLKLRNAISIAMDDEAIPLNAQMVVLTVFGKEMERYHFNAPQIQGADK
jgi:hypothetical protein